MTDKSSRALAGSQTASTYPPRGLSRIDAARYLGIGTTLFDEMVADGRMPKPKTINNRRVWDRLALDAAFADLPEAGGNAWDRLLQQRNRGL
jgi:hypothetical protein